MPDMNVKNYLPLVLLVSLITACGSEDETATPDVPSSNTAPPAAPAAAPATAPVNNTTAPASGIALNPEHGKPGHRCDIAVGAPLNSPPGNTNSATTLPANPVQAAPTPAPSPAPANNLTPSKGVINPSLNPNALNPAHGQPGHRCDIAVGAPLNSQPSKQ